MEPEGEVTLKGFEMAERGVGRGPFTFGDRRFSKGFMKLMPPEVAVAGVVSCDRLDFALNLSGLGETLPSAAGDFGGTSGGYSGSS